MFHVDSVAFKVLNELLKFDTHLTEVRVIYKTKQIKFEPQNCTYTYMTLSKEW